MIDDENTRANQKLIEDFYLENKPEPGPLAPEPVVSKSNATEMRLHKNAPVLRRVKRRLTNLCTTSS